MIDRRLQLTRKQQNHGFLAVTLKSSRRHHVLVNRYGVSVSQICSVCRYNNPVISSFMFYHQVCTRNNDTGAKCMEQKLVTIPEQYLFLVGSLC